jgi:hypothetical protein
MPRGRSLPWAVAFASAVVGLACKKDADPAAAFVADYCDVYKPCCTAAGLPGDGKACRDMFASTSSPQAKYDATQGDACLTGLQQQSTMSGFCEGSIVPPSACSRAFGGNAGSDCIQDGDCPSSTQGQVQCVSGAINGMPVRKCQVLVRGQAGSMPCVGTVRGGQTEYSGTSSGDIPDQGYLCDEADGLRCDRDPDRGDACVALTADGANCMLSTDCVVGDFCDANGGGVCAARKGNGAGCIDQAGECQDGLYCNTTSLTCVPQLDMGAACTDNLQCRTDNCPDGTCQPTPSVGTNGICGTG